MALKVTASIIVLLLPLAGLILSNQDFPQRQKTPVTTEDDLLTKLSIERMDKKTSAPDFTLKDLSGETVRLRDLRGKVVFLNFWATWCPPCQLEMPMMEKLHKEFGNQGLVILAINNLEGSKEIKAFIKQHNLTFTTLLDEKGKVFELYRTWSLPTTYLIGKNGEVVGKVIGYRDWHSDLARSLLRQLLEDRA